MNKEYKKKVNLFVMGLGFFYFVLFLMIYDAEITIYNTSLLAFSYKYGFIPRAFVGTVYQLIDTILPVNMYTYPMAMRFVELVTAVFFLLMLLVARKTMLMASEKHFRLMGLLWIIYGTLFVSMFSSKYNFGRVDLFMLLIDVVGVLLLLYRRCEWLIIPMSMMGVLVHEGFVFMYFGILLVILFYRFMTSNEKKKYGLIFALSFIGASALFLYIHFVREPVSDAVFMEIYRQGRRLSNINMPHVSLLQAELLCVNLGNIEKVFHMENFVQLPMFLVLISPYLILLAKIYKKIMKPSKSLQEKLIGLAVICGWMTLLPNYLLKVDYGRWVFATFSYMLLAFITMIADGNQLLIDSFEEEHAIISKHPGLGELLLIYPILLVPFWDVYINGMLKELGDWINIYLRLY